MDSRFLEAGGTAARRGEAEAWARAWAAVFKGGVAGPRERLAGLRLDGLSRLCGRRCGSRPACLRSSRADEGRVGQRMEGALEPALDWQLFTSEARCGRSQADRRHLWESAHPAPGSARPPDARPS